MRVSFDTIKIEISESEARTLYGTIRIGLERTIDDHWKNHPDSYERNEAERIHMLRELGRATGNSADYDLKDLRTRLDKAVAVVNAGKRRTP